MMKGILIVLLVLLLGNVILLYLLAPRLSGRRRVHPFFGVKWAHRGLHDIKKGIPENSIPAFQAAIEAGYGIELDVHLTKDGKLVVFHDDDFRRICGEKGKVVKEPASHIDLAPTIMDYFGKKLPKIFAGKSMLPQIYDASKKINDVVFTEFTRYEVDHDGFGGLQMMRAAVTERYKLAIHLMDTDEFYDTYEDNYEVHNQIQNEAYASIRNELHDQILKEMDNTRDMYLGYQWAVRPWRTDYEPTLSNGGYTRQKEEEELYEPRQLDYDTGLPMKEAVRRKNQH